MPRPKNTPWNNGMCHTPKAIGIRAKYRKAQDRKAQEKKASETQQKESK